MPGTLKAEKSSAAARGEGTQLELTDALTVFLTRNSNCRAFTGKSHMEVGLYLHSVASLIRIQFTTYRQGFFTI